MKSNQKIQSALLKSKTWLKHETPTILSCIAAVGTIATAVLAVKATPKALELIKNDSKKNHEGDPDAATKSEMVKSAWKCYIPSAVVGTTTIVCIFSANALNKRQQEALMSAYALLSSGYHEYKEKVKEIYGEEAHQNIIDSIVKEKVKETHISAPTLLDSCSLDFDDDTEEVHLFLDQFSNRFFETTFSKVLQAEYHLNRNFALGGCVPLNDFYEFLGLETTDYGSTVGWGYDSGLLWIDFDHHKVQLDGEPDCWVICMAFEPQPNFDEYQ